MTRAIWKASIQFGPVSVPVKLYGAVRDTRLHSHLLHDRDRHRLQQAMVCPEDGATVEPGQMAKGYQIDENEYVLVDPDELDALEPQASRAIQVTQFVEAGRLDPRYLDRTFFLGPDEDEQAYVNLVESLRETGLAGICRWVMRDKSYLGVLHERDGLLRLTAHRYADEVVPEDSLAIKRVEPSRQEVAIAENLVKELAESFRPELYQEEYEAKLRQLIDQKAQGKEVKLPRPEPVAPTRDEDLVGVLERSLDALKR